MNIEQGILNAKVKNNTGGKSMEISHCLKFQNQFLKYIVAVGGMIVLLFFLLSISMANEGLEDLFAIKAARIITVTGSVIENGTIIVKNGIIDAVGKDIPIPVGAEMINVDTMSVYPGLIDAHTSLALKLPQQKEATPSSERSTRVQSRQPSTALTPERLVADLLNPKDSKIEKVRETGVTTVLTVPERGIFIGQSALINLAGNNAEEMILKSPVASHIGYTGQRGIYPATLMAVIAYQRQTFYDAQHHKFLMERYARQKRGWKRPVPDKSLDALIPVLSGDMPVIITANKENEIKRALRLAGEFGLNFLISGAVEGWRVVDLLKARGRPVLISVEFPKPESVTGYSFKLKLEGSTKEKPKKGKEKPEKKKKENEGGRKGGNEEDEKEKEMVELYVNASALYKVGVKFAFASGGLKKPGDFIKNIAKTIKHGLPKEEALNAMTIYPAEIFGVADQIGSIEAGKIANLVLATGDIFDEKTKVKYVFVDGKKYEIKIKEKKETEKEATVDVAGTWDVIVDSSQGEVSVTLTLNQSGSEITGELKTEFGTASIYDGSISGNNIGFSVKLPITGQPVEIIFEGTIKGNTMEGTTDLGEMDSAAWTATKPGNWSFKFK